MPSVLCLCVPTRNGTVHRSKWRLLARDSGRGVGPWLPSCGASPGPRVFGSQAGHCQPGSLTLSEPRFPICNKGCLNELGGWQL